MSFFGLGPNIATIREVSETKANAEYQSDTVANLCSIWQGYVGATLFEDNHIRELTEMSVLD